MSYKRPARTTTSTPPLHDRFLPGPPATRLGIAPRPGCHTPSPRVHACPFGVEVCKIHQVSLNRPTN
eukprot:2094575-Pyramimonas_sp.AAC.1